jgi:hypothetical protein
LLFSPIFCIKKDSCGYAKEKVLKKWTSVQVKQKNKKRKKNNNKDSPCFLAKFLSSKRKINSSRSKV